MEQGLIPMRKRHAGGFMRAAYAWKDYPRVLAVVFVKLRLIAVNSAAEDGANIIQLYFDRPPSR